MKRITAIIVVLLIILSGCSGANKSADTVKNASAGNSEQTQLNNTSQNAKDSNAANTSLLENIDTSKSPFEKGYYDYQGTINNNIPILMSIYPLEKYMVGSYFYLKQGKELKLQGKAGENDIVLYEYDESGKNTGIFQGKMSTVDKIEGTWTSSEGKRSYPFSLSLKSNLPGVEYGKRYSVAVNTYSDEDVENFAGQIQSYVENNNKEQLAELISYPIGVKINGKAVEIQNRDDFIMNYDRIFYPDYRQEISSASTRYMFVNWQGIMFGDGLYNMWINEVTSGGSSSKLIITAINN